MASRPLPGDPIERSLKPGADISVLGIQLETRRRNRVTGRITAADTNAFSIAVDQAFGNCPQYIQTRSTINPPEIISYKRAHSVVRQDGLDARTRQLITNADTFFIASATPERPTSRSRNRALGVDISHRGGKPGFVQIQDSRNLVYPEFPGNNHFNTIGNLVLNPKAGLLFIDFETGHLAYLTGSAHVVWDGPMVRAFKRAERLVRFTAESIIRLENAFPFRFALGELSPALEQTGDWQEAADLIGEENEKTFFAPYEIVDIQKESDVISSFYLRQAAGRKLAAYQAGQFLPIRVAIPGREDSPVRNYTLSSAPGGDFYRLSIKREEGNALVSNFVHDGLSVGDTIEAMAPRGKFVLDRSSDRPVVLISGGVGITPMIAMTESLINEGERTGKPRRIHFVHGAKNGTVHAFGEHIRALAMTNPNLSVHIRYSDPDEKDELVRPHDSVGLVDIDLLKRILPFNDYDFYLCAPQPFMQSIYNGLIATGVRNERIHYESFGIATVFRHRQREVKALNEGESAGPTVAVRFDRSGIETTWSSHQGTLLQLAQFAGLNPEFGCRSGICGICRTRIKSGTVDYVEDPSAPHGDDEVLICCATPRSMTNKESCGNAQPLVLDL